MSANEQDLQGHQGKEPDLPSTPPPAPILEDDQDGDIPIESGNSRILGIRRPHHGEPFYYLADSSLRALFASRYKRRFPFTAEGWAQAWREFASEDPKAATRYSQAAIDPATQAQVSRASARLNASQFAVVTGCVLIGGYGYDPLALSAPYDVHFTDSESLITEPGSPEPKVRVQYPDVLGLRVDGPGAVTRGGSFFGGGSGVAGAAEGMIVASVLNALTTRTKIQTILEVQDRTRDFVFFQSQDTPQQLQVRLLPVQAKLRQVAADVQSSPQDPSTDPLDRLERLARLHQAGALTDAEFETAKHEILSQL